MNRRLFTRGATAGLAVLACLLPAAPAGAGPAPGGSFSGDLTGVSCTDGVCWAVGSTGNNAAIADHWNGSAWARADSGLNAAFNAVSCTVGLTCLGVGINSSEMASSERWDGSQWHPVTTPAPSGTDSQLNGISCVTASDCWAVGDQFTATTTLNLIEHWDGKSWSVFA